jgi:FAD:protein FMN transferase
MRPVTAFLALALLCAGGCAPAPQQFDGPTMGTTYSVTVTRLPDGVKRETLQEAIDAILSAVNRHLSTYDPASEISAFNASRSTAEMAASPMLHAVAGISREVSAASGGAFDITVAPLVRAWGFGGGQAAGTAVPDRELLDRIKPRIGYQKLVQPVGRRALQKAVPELELDVAGIAPGYAVDLIAERFEALGVRDYLVELGGEVRARGRSPAGRPWRVAVEAPVGGEPRPYALVELDRMSASTSGDYRDFRVTAGRRYSHTIDPRSGAPVNHQMASVCVLHRSAAYADAYATALMVLGPEQGYELATRLGLAALFIEHDVSGGGFHERVTPRFEQLRRPLD